MINIKSIYQTQKERQISRTYIDLYLFMTAAHFLVDIIMFIRENIINKDNHSFNTYYGLFLVSQTLKYILSFFYWGFKDDADLEIETIKNDYMKLRWLDKFQIILLSLYFYKIDFNHYTITEITYLLIQYSTYYYLQTPYNEKILNKKN